jgi:hypothetical protein
MKKYGHIILGMLMGIVCGLALMPPWWFIAVLVIHVATAYYYMNRGYELGRGDKKLGRVEMEL